MISSQLKVTRLVVESDDCKKDRWWHVSRPVDEYLEICRPPLFVHQLHCPILTQLKHFRINVSKDLAGFDFNNVNAFTQLVHLEVTHPIRPLSAGIDWKLPQLQTLKFLFPALSVKERSKFPISIECPKLKALSCDITQNDWFEVKSPETITTFRGYLYGPPLAKFRNTEIYQCRTELRHVNGALVQQLPVLKRLEIEGELSSHRFQLNIDVGGGLDNMRWFLKRLLNDRRQVARPDLRLFFAGVEIVDEAFVDRLDLRMVRHSEYCGLLLNEYLYFGDYPADSKPNLQEELQFVEQVNYDLLVSLADEISEDYFRRFWNIRILCAKGEIQDPDHFAFFIERLEDLLYLNMSNPALNQSWYDRLPTICSLKSFKLREKDEIELNFDFLGLFEPPVQHLNINRDLALRSARSLPNLIKWYRDTYLAGFGFKFRGADAVIQRGEWRECKEEGSHFDVPDLILDLKDDYDVLINKKLKLKRANSMEVVNYFEGLEKELTLL